MLKIMYDNITVAHIEGTEGNYKMVLEDNLHPFYIPDMLFKHGAKEVDTLDVIEWIKTRIFPPNRFGVEELLEQLGLDEYRPFAIAQKTKACLVEDGWWVSFYPEDNFRDNTTRGKAGFPLIDL